MEIANDGLDSLDDIEISATKPTGKRSANLDEGQVVATKETKIACVKNKSTKKKKILSWSLFYQSLCINYVFNACSVKYL
jgi:hypothetical protein